MVKVIKKQSKPHDRKKTAAVEWAASEFKVTTSYVYSIIRGDKKDGQSDEILKAYKKKYNELKQILA